MRIENKVYRTIWFENNLVKIIDQTKLPHQFIIKDLKTVDDAIKATIKASNIKKKNEIINIGSDVESKIIDVARLIMKIFKINPKKLKLFSAPVGSVLKRRPDISKLRMIIGKTKFLSLEEGIKLLIKKK